MNDSTEEIIQARELTIGQFLRLAFLGSVRSPKTGRKLVLESGAGKVMTVIAGVLPILFLVIFVTGTFVLSWINVIVFLAAIVGIYVLAMRSAKLEETET